MATATTATSSSVFFSSHTKTRFQSKPISSISFPSSNFLQKNTNLKLQRVELLPSRLEFRKQLKIKVSANKESFSSNEEIQSLVSNEEAAVVNQDEVFSRTSVILPFLFPALGGLLFGYDIGAISGAAVSLQSPKLSGTTWFNLSSIQLGLVVSGSLYGAFISSILIHPIAHFLGRRRELIIAAMLYMLGGLTTGLAPSLSVLILGRFLYGLGIGLAMHGAPQYIAETCPSQIRGKLVFMKELIIVFGILLGYLARNIDAVGGWRYMFGFSAPVALLMGLGMWSLPASPRWLLLRAVQGKASLQENKERAITGLSRLRGRPSGDKVCEKQVEEILVSLKEAHADQESEGSFWKVFRELSIQAVTVCVGLVLFLQITGHPSLLHYTGSIPQTAGFAAASVAARVAVVIGLLKFLIFLGRRPLLIEGVSGITTVSLVFLSAYYKILQGHPLVAVGALLLYIGCYKISFAPISWLMVSETLPIRIRERGISQYGLSVLKTFGANVLVYFAPSSLKEQIASQLVNILLFVGIALASVLFVVFIVPESKG
ncbi:hypothetical protein C5167_000269 [Papaver somniferum]|uniref:Major facilitator superfamily (MFS) profile domain-containing protein n=1 Tax=Papaver somniferum TaxID=3469 RepID=A0A4Y7KUA9_PAPSO|nr:D-xylose-proton symporter-like 3, chloroplastic [Papaver somniferum]RZC75940.1 hypothetical protein C5167_000269 [Papaver somniferum]